MAAWVGGGFSDWVPSAKAARMLGGRGISKGNSTITVHTHPGDKTADPSVPDFDWGRNGPDILIAEKEIVIYGRKVLCRFAR